MFKRSMPRLRLGLVSAAVTGLLVVSTGSVAADTGPLGDLSFSQDGKSADANAGQCASNGNGTTTCSDAGISIFAGTTIDDVSGTVHARQVCVNLTTYTFVDETGDYVDEPTSESGCRDGLSTNTLRFEGKLKGVSLAATTVAVGSVVCDKSTDEFTCVPGPTHDVRVSGKWTGVGPLNYTRYNLVSDDGTCRTTQSELGNTREAAFAGTIAGRTVNADVGQLGDGKSSFRRVCRNHPKA